MIRVAKQLSLFYFIESTSSLHESRLHKHLFESDHGVMPYDHTTAPIKDIDGTLKIYVGIGIRKIAGVVRLFCILLIIS